MFFVSSRRFVCCIDRGLHFYMHDIGDRNVHLPADITCRIWHWNNAARCSIQFKIQ